MHKYARLINELEQRLEDGSFRSGQKLPSIRDLSESYRCSKSTVIRAYMELEKRHLIYSIPQSGYYAVQRKADSEPAKRFLINFSSAAPDPEVFPYMDFQHCINKAIDTYKNDLFQYGTPQGLSSLLKVMSKHLSHYQVFANPDRIFVTSGVQQALSVLTLMPFPNGKRTVLLEQPSYHLFLQLLECYQTPVFGIKRTEEGIDLNELEHLFRTKDIKFFYTMPRFQNPLGTSYTEKTKKAIAELAKRYDVYVVEDDYLADLENDSKSDPIYAYDASHIIYLKSYSKILFPGLRVGAAVLPTPLKDTFSTYKRLSDIDSSMLSQAALEIYIQSGMFERRRQKIKDSYNRRVQELNRALDASNDTGYVHHFSAHAGTHTHLLVPAELPIAALQDRLKKKHILMDAPDPMYLPDFEKQPLLKISITRVKEEEIRTGIAVVFDEIKKMMDKTR